MVRETGLNEGLPVASHTIRRKPLELADRRPFVTSIAIDGGMRPDQRKTVLVVPDGFELCTPSLYGVAGLALSSELAPVNVRMAIGALGADIGEHQTHVALFAGDAGMQPAEWVLRLVMVKLWQAAQRRPGRKGVAILAGNTQIAVRASRNRALGGRLPRHKGRCWE